MVVLWAEQDVILADEFRDGNVPAGSGNRRMVEQALAALPRGVDEIRLRADSALYEQPLLRWLEARGIGYAISADMGRELAAAIRALPERAWQPQREDTAAVRHWAEVPYVPSDGVSAKGRSEPPRYLAIRIIRKQGELFADGSTRPYRSGRVESRIKIKCGKRDAFLIVAFVEKLGATPRRIASLNVGRREADRLLYAGKVRSGYTEAAARDLRV